MSPARGILGHRDLAGLEALDQDLAGGGDRDGQQRADEAAGRAADQDAQDHEERRDPDRVPHHERDEDVALDQLQDEVDAGDRQGELRRDGRGDEDGRDRAEERPDDRDRLGERRDQPEQERRRARRAGCRRWRSRRRSCAIRISWPRTHIPSRVSAAFQTSRARLRRSCGHEREDVALEPGVLGQPEVDDRQERQDRGDRLGDRQPDLDDLARRRRGVGRGWTRPGRGVDERGHARATDRWRSDRARPSPGPGRRTAAATPASARAGRWPPGTTTKAIPTTTARKAP